VGDIASSHRALRLNAFRKLRGSCRSQVISHNSTGYQKGGTKKYRPPRPKDMKGGCSPQNDPCLESSAAGCNKNFKKFGYNRRPPTLNCCRSRQFFRSIRIARRCSSSSTTEANLPNEHRSLSSPCRSADQAPGGPRIPLSTGCNRFVTNLFLIEPTPETAFLFRKTNIHLPAEIRVSYEI